MSTTEGMSHATRSEEIYRLIKAPSMFEMIHSGINRIEIFSRTQERVIKRARGSDYCCHSCC